MRSILLCLALTGALSSAALAQPSQPLPTQPAPYPQQPYPQQPYPQQPYPQQPYPQQPYAGPPGAAPCQACYPGQPYQPYDLRLILTAEELELLAEGEISQGQYIAGGLTASFVGFGVGHMVLDRWSKTGWIYTVGESAAMLGLLAGIGDRLEACPVNDGLGDGCRSEVRPNRLLVGSLVLFMGLRTVEIIDAWVTPPRHNRRVRALRGRLGGGFAAARLSPYLTPTERGDGGVAGVMASF